MSQTSSFRFCIWAQKDDDLVTDYIPEGLDLRLYIYQDGEYIDITPDDFTIEGNGPGENGIGDYAITHSMEELKPGYYRLEYGDYHADFQIDLIFQEAW